MAHSFSKRYFTYIILNLKKDIVSAIKTLNIKFFKVYIFKLHKLKRTLISEERSFLAFLFLKFMEELRTFIKVHKQAISFQRRFDQRQGNEHRRLGKAYSNRHRANRKKKKL